MGRLLPLLLLACATPCEDVRYDAWCQPVCYGEVWPVYSDSEVCPDEEP
jgi:hypothetical protein